MSARADGRRARRGRRIAGFTLIEMMVSITIIGILASVAIPAFMKYKRKSQTVEMYDGVDKIAKGAIIYFNQHEVLPPPAEHWAPQMLHKDRCASGFNRFPIGALNDFNTPIWTSLLYKPGDRVLYRYHWGRSAPDTGVAEAQGDLDCDDDTSLFQTFLFHSGTELKRLGTFVVIGDETE